MRAPPPTGPLMAKPGPREQMLVEIVAPIDAELENEKGDAEYPGCGAALDEPAAIPGLDEGDTRAIYEAADHQNHGVDRADCELGVLGAGIEPSLVPVAGIESGGGTGGRREHSRPA